MTGSDRTHGAFQNRTESLFHLEEGTHLIAQHSFWGSAENVPVHFNFSGRYASGPHTVWNATGLCGEREKGEKDEYIKTEEKRMTNETMKQNRKRRD